VSPAAFRASSAECSAAVADFRAASADEGASSADARATSAADRDCSAKVLASSAVLRICSNCCRMPSAIPRSLSAVCRSDSPAIRSNSSPDVPAHPSVGFHSQLLVRLRLPCARAPSAARAASVESSSEERSFGIAGHTRQVIGLLALQEGATRDFPSEADLLRSSGDKDQAESRAIASSSSATRAGEEPEPASDAEGSVSGSEWARNA
jgi:hypothetical protein